MISKIKSNYFWLFWNDIYNMSGTDLLYRGLPHNTLSLPSEKCKDENLHSKIKLFVQKELIN